MTDFDAGWIGTVHTEMGHELHFQVWVLTCWGVPLSPSYRLHPYPGSGRGVVLHFTSYGTSFAANASLQIDNQAQSYWQISFLSLEYVYSYIIHGHVRLKK